MSSDRGRLSTFHLQETTLTIRYWIINPTSQVLIRKAWYMKAW